MKYVESNFLYKGKFMVSIFHGIRIMDELYINGSVMCRAVVHES
jgi:hypothetical protein